MRWRSMLVILGGVSALSAGLVLSPAQANHAPKRIAFRHQVASVAFSGIGSFTPAAADPRLAAAFARANLMNSGFRFTPSGGAVRLGHGITVAVRSRSAVAPVQLATHMGSTAQVLPIAYNLGVALGWKKFALTGDFHSTDLGLIEGGREGAGIGLSYNARKWSSRVMVATDRTTATRQSALGSNQDISLDVGGAFRLTRNVDLTAGVRYKREIDSLDQLTDTKRDGQAVYIGTQFKF